MPFIKEISKSRRIPKEKQSSGSGESIDDENTELDEEFIKIKKLLKESSDQKLLKRIRKTLKDNLLKHQHGDASEPSSDTELPKIKYPQPLPKIDKNKKTVGNELNSLKKSGIDGNLGAKNKPLSKPLKKGKDLGKNTVDGSNSNPGASLNRKTTQQNNNDKKEEKSPKVDKITDPENKRDGKPKKQHIPLSKSDRELAKNEVEAMIRMVLRHSREEGGGGEDIDDVSLGKTESTPSDEEIDIGKDPEMSSTPDDVSGETLSDDDDKNFVF